MDSDSVAKSLNSLDKSLCTSSFLNTAASAILPMPFDVAWLIAFFLCFFWHIAHFERSREILTFLAGRCCLTGIESKSSLIFLQSKTKPERLDLFLSALMAITSQTNESVKESKQYDSEDAICVRVPSEQNSSVRLYRSKTFVELEERIQNATNFFDPSRVAQNLTCRILAKKTHKRPSNLKLF